MIPILAGVLVWLPAVVGLGSPLLLVTRKLRPYRDASDIVFVGLAGLATLGTTANLLNLLIPVNSTVALLLLLTGWVLFVLSARYWFSRVPRLGLIVFGMAVLIYVAYSLRKPISHYDSGLYYLQTIKWISESKTPLGLANLHGRLGFNSLWFSIAAALEIAGLQHKSSFILNGILLILYGLAVGSAAATLGSAKKITLSSIFLILSAMVWIGAAKGQHISSHESDIPIILLAVLSTLISIRTLESREGWAYHNLVNFLVAVLAITMKLSAVPLLLAPIITLSWHLYRFREQFDEHRRTLKRILAIGLAAASLLLIPWMIRGVALSGCIAYPIPVGCFSSSLDWAVPISAVEQQSASIRSWARAPGRAFSEMETVLTSWEWFLPWLTDQFIPSSVTRRVASLVFFGFILLGIGARQKCELCKDWKIYVLPGLAPFLGIVFWFFTAPGMEFGAGYFWSLGLLVLSIGVHRLYLADRPTRFNRVLLVACAAIILASSGGLGWRGYQELFADPHEMFLSWPSMPAAQVEENYTEEGVRILSPTSGEQCWNADLPCTPGFSSTLKVTLGETGLPERFQVPR